MSNQDWIEPSVESAAVEGPWFVAEGGVCMVNCPEDGSNVICCEPERLMKASLARWPERAHAISALPELLTAGMKLLSLFDELRSTTIAERIITGRSDSDLRKASEEAMVELRTAISKATGGGK